MAGISSKALKRDYAENKRKFNEGTELNTDFDVSLYETDFRLYDPQIGRFWQIDELAGIADNWSPYVYALNNPILLNDPLGLTSDTATLPEVIVTPSNNRTSTPQTISLTGDQPDPSKSVVGRSVPTLNPGPYPKNFLAELAFIYGVLPKKDINNIDDLDEAYKLWMLFTMEYTIVEPYDFWGRLWNGSEGENIFGEPVPSRIKGGYIDIGGRAKAAKGMKYAVKLFKRNSKTTLKKLPTLDKSLKVHTWKSALPKLHQLKKYSAAELKEFLRDLKASIRTRAAKNAEFGKDAPHARRLAEEERIVKFLKKLLNED